MSIPIKSPDDIQTMRAGGKITAQILQELLGMIRPGISAAEIETRADKLIRRNNVGSAFKGFSDYPFHTVICVNDEVVHGMPLPDKIFKNGDVVTIDFGTKYKDFYTDTAMTKIAGDPKSGSGKFLEVGQRALNKAIQQCHPGKKTGDIGYTIQSIIEQAGFSTIRAFVGHGVGKDLHEPPQIPGFGEKNTGTRLETGMVIAVEVMYSMGDYEVVVLDDGWTAVMADGSVSGMFEHTVAITNTQPIIITQP